MLTGPDRHVGAHRLVRAEGLWTLSVSGTPYELGLAHGTLTQDLREGLEEETFSAFSRAVPHPLGRALIVEGVMLLGAGLDAHVDPRWRMELAGLVDSTPDPNRWMMPTYTRKLYLHALHDIGQALVDSPLVACTGFLAKGEATADGHLMLARNFDFEGGRQFDDEKVVAVRRPVDGLASVSVAFAGMVGVVSGINEAHIAVALQAAGSDAQIRMSEPMTLVLREVMEDASSLDQVQQILTRRKGFATELVLAADGRTGEAALFEVTPEAVARIDVDDMLGVSNHLRSEIFASDAENARRQEEQTTGQRLARMEELLAEHHGNLDLNLAVQILRDRRGPGDTVLPRGHRWAINADIATHAVAIDATAGILWVSASPSLSGGFVAYRLDELLEGELTPRPVVPALEVPSTLATLRARELLRADRPEEALFLMPEHPEVLLAVAELRVAEGRLEEAAELAGRAQRAQPEDAKDRRRAQALLGHRP